MGFENLWLDEIDDNPLGLILEMLIFIYCFAGLAEVCDKYLVVSLETLCVRWNVREDVAGATFMAFGSAAPEIIINALGTITGESDLGVGAIIGSGMIAFSVIPGLCALVAGGDLMLKRRPLARDSFFYLLSLSMLTYYFSDGFITMGEAASLFSLYVIYVTLVFLSPKIRMFMQKRKREAAYEIALKEAMVQGADRTAIEELKAKYLTVEATKSFVEQSNKQPTKSNNENLSTSLLGDNSSVNVPIHSDDPSNDDGLIDGANDDEAAYEPPSHEDEEEDQSTRARLYRGFTMPLSMAFKYTCVACEHDGPNAKWYPLTFLVAFLWVSFLSFTISAVAGRWNDLSGLPLSLFGIVLVAVGAEIPDTISSLAVARRGYGSMAISNSCGSQITNILFGLGLPWTLANLIGIGQGRVPASAECEDEPELCEPYDYDEDARTIAWSGVQVADHDDVLLAAGFQFLILLTFVASLLFLALAQRKDKATLNKKKGAILVVVYVVAVCGYMILSRAVVQPETDFSIYPPLEE